MLCETPDRLVTVTNRFSAEMDRICRNCIYYGFICLISVGYIIAFAFLLNRSSAHVCAEEVSILGKLVILAWIAFLHWLHAYLPPQSFTPQDLPASPRVSQPWVARKIDHTKIRMVTGGQLLRHLRHHPQKAQTTSPLLRLPAEIRNKIILYTLTADLPLLFVDGRNRKRSFFVELPQQDDEELNQHEFNSIKHTCRQLYAETATLEVGLNILQFVQCKPEYLAVCRAKTHVTVSEFLHTRAEELCPTPTHVITVSRRHRLHEQQYHRERSVLGYARKNPGILTEYYIDPGNLQHKDIGLHLFQDYMTIAIARGSTAGLDIPPLLWNALRLSGDPMVYLNSIKNVRFRIAASVDRENWMQAILRDCRFAWSLTDSQKNACLDFLSEVLDNGV